MESALNGTVWETKCSSLMPAWSTQQVPAYPGLHCETLNQNKHTNKNGGDQDESAGKGACHQAYWCEPAMGQAYGERTPRSRLLHSTHTPWHIQKRWRTCMQFSGTVCTECVPALSLISSNERADRNHLWLKMPKIYHLALFRKVCYSWYSNNYLKKT